MSILSFQNIAFFLMKPFNKKGFYLTNSLALDGREKKIKLSKVDFVRYASLEVIANEINHYNIPGSVAEVGVFKGSFASQMNILFPDRKLYLFDTFEGFPTEDRSYDIQKGYSTGYQEFKDTSVDEVISKMRYKDNVVIKKGYFPATAEGLEEQFVFVNLDTDLYLPIIEGLKYFYPRLARGGYIFVHDFGNTDYKGVREAVKEFSDAYSVGYFPMVDRSGSVVFCK